MGSAAKVVDYATLSKELDDILDQMQSEDLQVDQAVKLYERGAEITKQLEAYLKSAENTISAVKGKG